MGDYYDEEWIADKWRWCSGCGRLWTYSDDKNCPCPESALSPFPTEVVSIVWAAYQMAGDPGVVPIERKLWRAHRRAERKRAKP